ncbi:PAS domain S-box protein [Halobacteriaceae bacterium SHR40]|uniref:PAS domain S-box protein n=1 Tax=Halovenus amylolytica TaxID=2500550 RepID=UPI000FE3A8F4
MTAINDIITVLYIDDGSGVTDRTVASLEREDERITVRTATNAKEGLDLLATSTVDCIVSEYDLPMTNGIEFLKTVRKESPDLPFILYTEHGSEEVASQAISAGVTEYLEKEKPGQESVLVDRIHHAVSDRGPAIDREQRSNRLEQILKTVPSCVVQLDRDGRFIFANDRAVEVLGLQQTELMDRAYNDPEWEISDLDGNPIPDDQLPFRQVRDTGQSLHGFRHKIRWPDETEKILSVNGAPLFDDDRSIESVVCSLTDITDRVERQSRIKETTARLEALFENSPDMINVHDTAGQITEVNSQLCEATGYSQSELTGMKVWELDQTVDPAAITNRWGEMAVGDRHRLEGVYQRKDGTTFPVEVHLRRLDLAGDDRFVVISRDISARKESEQQRQREHDRFQAVFEDSFDAMVITDDDGQYVDANESATELFGLAKKELLGRSIDDFAPENFDFETAWREFQQAENDRGIFPLVRPDGTERIVEYAATRDIMPGQHLSVIRDITEREERERELERMRELLEQTERIADIGGWEIDTETMDVFWSKPLFDLLGIYADEEPPLDKALDVYHKDDRPIVEEAVETALESGEPFDVEARFRRPDGEIRWLRVQGTPTIEDGEVVTLRGTVHDITERKEREEQLEAQNQRLSEFADIVSHDLRNPLTTAQGRLELARADCDSAHLESIEDLHERMWTLIDDLLALARTDTTVTDCKPVDLAAVASDCWTTVETGDATLVTNSHHTVQADKSRLKQLFENLIRNAIEHGGEDVTVTIGDLADGFYVADDGSGIPVDQQDEVFETGYSTNPYGTGFGLSIVQQVVEAHDWIITVTDGSDEGGARFEITGVVIQE